MGAMRFHTPNTSISRSKHCHPGKLTDTCALLGADTVRMHSAKGKLESPKRLVSLTGCTHTTAFCVLTGTDCTDCGPRQSKARSLEYDPSKTQCDPYDPASPCPPEYPLCIDWHSYVKSGSCARKVGSASASSRRQLQYGNGINISPRPPPDAPYPPPPNPPPLKPPPFPPPSPSPPPAPPGYYRSCGCHW